jgi:hypothetical protein
MKEDRGFEYVQRKSLTGTLEKMNLNDEIIINQFDFKPSIVRLAASYIKRKKGLIFKVSDAGRVTDVLVTRLK